MLLLHAYILYVVIRFKATDTDVNYFFSMHVKSDHVCVFY